MNSARLLIDADVTSQDFDRRPFRFTHNLSGLEEFSGDSLSTLAREFDQHPRDFFVSAGAPAADTKFFTVPHSMCSASEALNRLDSGAYRILLKRAENHDPRFRRLLDALFAQVMERRGGLRGERLVRLESGIFITSAASTTPVHFDPEINFFSQIEGEKIYHVYNPATLPEAQLERFYLQGQVSIGNVDLRTCKPEHENVYTLTAGSGLGGDSGVAVNFVRIRFRDRREPGTRAHTRLQLLFTQVWAGALRTRSKTRSGCSKGRRHALANSYAKQCARGPARRAAPLDDQLRSRSISAPIISAISTAPLL